MPDKDSLFIHSIGSKIRLYRKYRGLTQKELGDACGLNESTIRNYELGNRYPDKQTLTQIADTLHIDVFSLLDPDPNDPTGAIHVLFDIERCYGLIPKVCSFRRASPYGSMSARFTTKAISWTRNMTTGRALGLTLSTKTRCMVILRIPKSQTNSRNCRVRIKRLPHRIPGLKRKENASRRSRIRTERGCEVKKSRVSHPVNSWKTVPNGTR